MHNVCNDSCIQGMWHAVICNSSMWMIKIHIKSTVLTVPITCIQCEQLCPNCLVTWNLETSSAVGNIFHFIQYSNPVPFWQAEAYATPWYNSTTTGQGAINEWRTLSWHGFVPYPSLIDDRWGLWAYSHKQPVRLHTPWAAETLWPNLPGSITLIFNNPSELNRKCMSESTS